jgi:hypothetical protein
MSMRGRVLVPLMAIACGSLPATAADELLLRWAAGNERGVYGYIIYRAETAEGPFLRLNSAVVRVEDGEPDGDVRRYRYADTTVEDGVEYFYVIDVVGVNARRKRLPGMISKRHQADD